MRPPLIVALLCVLPNIAAFGMDVRPVLGARPRSPPAALRRFPQRATVPRRGILRLAADKSVEADVGPEGEFERKMRAFLFNFGDRILDPLNAMSYLTGRSLIESAEEAFVAGQKVAGQAVADGLVQSATVVGLSLKSAMIQFAAVVGVVIITVAPTVSTWMKSVLWVGAAVWAAWKQQKLKYGDSVPRLVVPHTLAPKTLDSVESGDQAEVNLTEAKQTGVKDEPAKDAGDQAEAKLTEERTRPG